MTTKKIEHNFVTSVLKIGGSYYLRIPKEIYDLDRPIQLFGKYSWTKDNVLQIIISDKPLLLKNIMLTDR